MNEVSLNVYDIVNNNYSAWAGIGLFHSGIVVHGREYSFCAHEGQTTGIFVVEPTTAFDLPLRSTVLLGKTCLSPPEVENLICEMGEEWTGNSYDMLSRNCNHFCQELGERLLGEGIPRYVNRLARLGALLRCVLPQRWVSSGEDDSIPHRDTQHNTMK